MDKKATLLIREKLFSSLKEKCEHENQEIEIVIERLISDHLTRESVEMVLTTKKPNETTTRVVSGDELYNTRLSDLIGTDIESVLITIKRNVGSDNYSRIFNALFEVQTNCFVKMHELWEALESAQKDNVLVIYLRESGFVIGEKIDAGCKAYKPFVKWILETFPTITKERKYGLWGFKGMKLK